MVGGCVVLDWDYRTKRMQTSTCRARALSGAALIFAALGWANTSNCPTGFTTSNTGASGVSVPFSSGSTLSSVETGTINGLSTGFTSGITAGGCFATDQSFSNLLISAAGQTATNSYVSTGTSSAGDYITFASIAGDTTSASDDSSNRFTTLSVVNGGLGVGGSIDFVDYSDFGTTATPAGIPGLSALTITISGITINNPNGSITVTAVGCSGVTGAGSAATFGSCAAGPGGTSLTPTTVTWTITQANVSGGVATLTLFNLPAGLTSLATDFTVTLNHDGTSFATFTEDFGTPEPSTFLLLGGGLAGLGFLRARRNRART